MRGIIGIGLFGLFLLTGCVFWGDTYHKKEVTSFVVDRKENPNLKGIVPAKIDQQDHTIVLRFPNTSNISSLVPRFQHSGLKATLEGRPFESGSQAVDFSKSHSLEVVGFDDTVQTYTIKASFQSLVFQSFEFLSPENPSLGANVSSTIDFPYYGNTGWWSPAYGWVEDFSAPTKSIAITLPASPPNSLVPHFTHNAVEVRWNGQPLVSGVTAIDATADQVLTLVGIDGSTQDVAIKYSYHPLALASLQLLVADNPTLRKDYSGTINAGTKVISVAVPNYVDATTLVARFTHNGTKVLVDGIENTSGTKIDLSKSHTLTLAGAGNRTQDYQLLVTSVSPSGSKQLLSRVLYGSVRQSPPFVPTDNDRIYSVYETSPTTDVYTLTTYSYNYSQPIDPALVYLEFQTTAIQVTGGQPLTPGFLSSGVYAPANWLDFRKPVVLTLTAEDLTTKTITLNLVVK